MNYVPPPRLPLRILEACATRDARGRSIVGDVVEEWHQRRAARSRLVRVWLWSTCLMLAGELLFARAFVLRATRSRPPTPLTRSRLVFHNLTQDLKLAARNLARRPLFTGLAAASLAVGIGANTAVFSVVNRLFVRPLGGIATPERVVELGSTFRGSGFDTFSFPEIQTLRESAPGLDAVAGWTFGEMSRALDGEAGGERVTAFWVSSEYFPIMGLQPFMGRFFAPEEDRPGSARRVVVVSHGFWRRALASDRSAIGRSVRLNRESYTVVGVAPQDFSSHLVGVEAEVWVPFALSEESGRFASWGSYWAFAVGRLAPSSSLEQADAEVRGVFRGLAQERPDTHAERGARVLPLGPVPGGGRGDVRAFLMALLGLVSLVLLVTCANVGGMVVARSATRGREVAVRAALGASRAHLVRYLGIEALLLFALGGSLGIALAYFGMSQIDLSTLPLPIQLKLDLRPDATVLVLSLLTTLVTGVVFGTLPALGSTRLDLVEALKGTGSARGGRTLLLRRLFVSGQIAFTLLLTAAAGLFLRSIREIDRVASGFEPDGVYMTSFDLSREGYTSHAERASIQALILEQAAALPGARGAALSRDLPLDLSTSGTSAVVDNRDVEDRANHIGVHFNSVSADYFDVLRIPILRGRAFEPSDREGATGVAVVSRTFVERAWPEVDPVGRSLVLLNGRSEPLTVVGVVEDVKNASITDRPSPFVYTSLSQQSQGNQILTVALSGQETTIGAQLIEAVRRADPSIAAAPVIAVTHYTGVGTLPHRLAAAVASSLGVVALLLSGIGIYGIIALSVIQRTREIGIRKALGASTGKVHQQVLRWTLWLSLPGLAVGTLLALLVAPLLRGFLVGVQPADPVAFVGVISTFMIVVAAASVVPARRAARVDPMHALRAE